MSKSERINFRLRGELDSWIQALARQKDTSASAIVREILIEKMNEKASKCEAGADQRCPTAIARVRAKRRRAA